MPHLGAPLVSGGTEATELPTVSNMALVSTPGRALPPSGRTLCIVSHPNRGGWGWSIKRLRRSWLAPGRGRARAFRGAGVVGAGGAL
jgi:hypothetical protein